MSGTTKVHQYLFKRTSKLSDYRLSGFVGVSCQGADFTLVTPKTLVKVLWYRVTGFFLMLSVVKCRQITSTVINYHVGWTISRYVTLLRMFVSLFVHLYFFNCLFFYLFNYV